MTSAYGIFVRSSSFVALGLLGACGPGGSILADASSSDASTGPADSGAPADSAARPDGAALDSGPIAASMPQAALLPSPPRYWYVDALPLSLTIGGTEVTHYRYRLDTDPEWSGDVAVGDALELLEVAPGYRTLSIVGCNAGSGVCQETPLAVSFHMATTRREDVECRLRAAGGPCDWIITGSGDLTNDGAPAWARTDVTPAPGDVICLQNDSSGRFDNLRIHAFEGSPEAPLTFVNCGGTLDLVHAGNGAAAIHFERSRYFRLVGTGGSDTYGIRVEVTGAAKAINVDAGSSDFEIAYVEVARSGQEGIAARTNVDGCEYHRGNFVQHNTFLHHNYIRNIGSEGLYVGGSHWGAAARFAAGTLACGAPGTVSCTDGCHFEPELRGVRVYANRIEDTESDCLQVSSAPQDPENDGPEARWDAHVYDNVAERCVDPATVFAAQGFSIQAGTNALVYRNFVADVGGTADTAMLIGGGGSTVFNNIIVADRNRGLAITMSDPGHNRPFLILANTVINTAPAGDGIYLYADIDPVPGNLVANNLVLANREALATRGWATEQNYTGPSSAMSEHFVDPGAGDYCLQAGSPAIDFGRDLAAHGVVDDFRRRPREPGAYDAGACERSE